jgi:hypothetical protein
MHMRSKKPVSLQASRRLIQLLGVLLISLASSPAAAIALDAATGVSYSASHEPIGGEEYINRLDCETPESFTFTLTGVVSGNEISVYGRDDDVATCSEEDQTAGTCVSLVAKQKATSTSIAISLTAADIANNVMDDVSSCASASDQGGTATLLFINESDASPTPIAYKIRVDTEGPSAGPTTVTATVNDSGKLDVKFSGGPSDADTYKAYCQKSDEVGSTSSSSAGGSSGAGASGGTGTTGGSGGAGGSGGSGGTGGTGGGTGGTTSAGGSGGSGGSMANFYSAHTGGAGGSSSSTSDTGSDGDGDTSSSCSLDAALTCTSITDVSGLTGFEISGEGTITVSGLEDCIVYSCVVTAIDVYGNEGAVSVTGCGMSGPVTDFFEFYRAHGGKAGGGCILTHRAAGHRPGLLALLLGLGLAWFWRRERRGGAA